MLVSIFISVAFLLWYQWNIPFFGTKTLEQKEPEVTEVGNSCFISKSLRVTEKLVPLLVLHSQSKINGYLLNTGLEDTLFQLHQLLLPNRHHNWISKRSLHSLSSLLLSDSREHGEAMECWHTSGFPLPLPAHSAENQPLCYKLLRGETGMGKNWCLWEKANKDLRSVAATWMTLQEDSPQVEPWVSCSPGLIVASWEIPCKIIQLNCA